MNLDLLTSCTHVYLTPRFDAQHQVVMCISLWRKDSQLAPEYQTDFAECARLLNQMRQRGFRTVNVDDLGMTLEKR